MSPSKSKSERKVITMCHYQRPEYTRHVLESLRRCEGIGEYLILPHVEPGNEEVRAAIEAIDFAECRPHFNPERLGCNANTDQALAVGFAHADYVIHIEDDIVCAPDALRFYEWARVHYETDPRIFNISGYNRIASPEPGAARFQVRRRRSFSPWGWATWQDRWDQFAGALRVLTYPWDLFLNIAFAGSPIRMYREEAFPALSRSQHIGLVSSVSPHHTPEWYEANLTVYHWAGDYEIPSGTFSEGP